MRRPRVAPLAIAASIAILASCGRGGDGGEAARWPARTVRFVTPLAAGGGPDLVARLLAQKLSARWQQPVIVDNRPGGDGIVAARAVIDAADDHTLLFAPNSIVTANLAGGAAPYAAEDFVPIASVVDVPIAVVSGAAFDAAGVLELLDLARQRPGRITYTAVFGAPQIVWSRLLADRGIDMPLVGYRNPNIAIPDLIEGRVGVALLPLGTTLGGVRNGQLRLLAVLSERRSSVMPSVPTIAEAGVAEATAAGALGVFALRDIAAVRRDSIAADIAAELREPALIKQLLTAGFETLSMGPAGYAAALGAQRTSLLAASPNR
jgi:tripartite-type tricarboxylate transporter receptor subunit TctC